MNKSNFTRGELVIYIGQHVTHYYGLDPVVHLSPGDLFTVMTTRYASSFAVCKESSGQTVVLNCRDLEKTGLVLVAEFELVG